MEVLAALRLSRDQAGSTSIEGQREAIIRWAAANGHKVTAESVDVDVSGSVPARERPDLARALAASDARIVAGIKIDRISRDTADFLAFARWLNSQGKILVSTGEGIWLDGSGSAADTFTATMLASVATMERHRMSERAKDSRTRLAVRGRWPGGRVPFGYRPVKDAAGWTLAPDPVAAPLVREVAAKIIGGMSASAVCKELTDEKIPVPSGAMHCSSCRKPVRESSGTWQHKDGKPLCAGAEVVPAFWRSDVLIRIMRSPVLQGYVVADGEIVTGDDGMPVRRKPVLSDDVWNTVQKVLDSGSQRKSGRRSDASPLLHVAICGLCSSTLYLNQRKSRTRGHYVCGSVVQQTGCTSPSARADHLHVAVERALLDALADVPMREKVTEPGQDHSDELADAEKALAHNDERYAAGKISDERHGALAAILEKKRHELAALPSKPGRSYWRETGETFGQHWQSMTIQERRVFLVSAGVRVRVFRAGSWTPPADLVHFHPAPDEDELHAGPHTLLAAEGRVHALILLGDLAKLRDMAASAAQGGLVAMQPGNSLAQ